MAEIQALINRQHLHLMKHRRMGGIHRIPPIHPAWSHDPHRWWIGFQVSDLHRRGVGAQQQVVLQIKRVLHVSSRVLRRNIQGREVVVIRLHLRTFLHLIPKAAEQINNLLRGGDQRMPVPHRHAQRSRCDIQGFRCNSCGHRSTVHRLKALRQQLLHQRFQHIGALAHQRPFISRQLAHRPEHG